MSERQEERAQQFLERFDRDPRAAMAEPLERFDRTGDPVEGPRSAFSDEEIRSGGAVLHRDSVRKDFRMVVDGVMVSLEGVLPGKSPIENYDRPENLVDKLQHRDLAAMEAAGLREATLPDCPWSDDYWALYLGCLGHRYADPSFPRAEDWEENYDYVRQRPRESIVSSGSSAAIDQLSPSEKYDLLVGGGTLTAAMWASGREYFDQSGVVETWMGICHGWAPAAYMLPRPRRQVSVLAADGRTRLRFYPTDIKALASLLWANANTVSRFIGGRCNDKDPATDAIGRPISPKVLDTNPGTWHQCVVNQLGVGRRSFVMDATYDYEVWNQPLYGYSYSYFNPQTLRTARSRAEATVGRAAFSRDRFSRYRGAAMATVTGVVMHARYVVENPAAQSPTDGPERDQIRTVRYVYDVEQDAAGRIIGGEWYTGKTHPDFLWTPPADARASSPADSSATGAWDPTTPLPAAWARAARRAGNSGLPLAKIVGQLIELARA